MLDTKGQHTGGVPYVQSLEEANPSRRKDEWLPGAGGVGNSKSIPMGVSWFFFFGGEKKYSGSRELCWLYDLVNYT